MQKKLRFLLLIFIVGMIPCLALCVEQRSLARWSETDIKHFTRGFKALEGCPGISRMMFNYLVPIRKDSGFVYHLCFPYFTFYKLKFSGGPLQKSNENDNRFRKDVFCSSVSLSANLKGQLSHQFVKKQLLHKFVVVEQSNNNEKVAFINDLHCKTYKESLYNINEEVLNAFFRLSDDQSYNIMVLNDDSTKFSFRLKRNKGDFNNIILTTGVEEKNKGELKEKNKHEKPRLIFSILEEDIVCNKQFLHLTRQNLKKCPLLTLCSFATFLNPEYFGTMSNPFEHKIMDYFPISCSLKE